MTYRSTWLHTCLTITDVYIQHKYLCSIHSNFYSTHFSKCVNISLEREKQSNPTRCPPRFLPHNQKTSLHFCVFAIYLAPQGHMTFYGVTLAGQKSLTKGGSNIIIISEQQSKKSKVNNCNNVYFISQFSINPSLLEQQTSKTKLYIWRMIPPHKVSKTSLPYLLGHDELGQ